MEETAGGGYWGTPTGDASNVEIYEDPAVSVQIERRNARYLEWLEGETGVGTIIDYGCGLGGFVDSAARRGWNAAGIDSSRRAVKHGQARGRSVWTLEEWMRRPPIDVGQANAVVMLDVLEHVDDLHSTLCTVCSLLAAQGLLLIETPSWRYLPRQVGLWLARATRGRIDWARFLVYPDHRLYFTGRSLADVLAEHGFNVLWRRGTTSSSEKILAKLKRIHRCGTLGLLLARGTLLLTRVLGGNKILLCARRTDLEHDDELT